MSILELQLRTLTNLVSVLVYGSRMLMTNWLKPVRVVSIISVRLCLREVRESEAESERESHLADRKLHLFLMI